jgi:hypothetical protein
MTVTHTVKTVTVVPSYCQNWTKLAAQAGPGAAARAIGRGAGHWH